MSVIKMRRAFVEIHCSHLPKIKQDSGQLYCNSTWDTVSCWPTTLAGHLAILPCPAEVNGYPYNTTLNASRMCSTNGTWQEKSNYSICAPLHLTTAESDSIHNYITRIIYYVGFTASVVALVIALFIFLYFRNLSCLRNKIHCHLIVTFILRNLLWVFMNWGLQELHKDSDVEAHQWICKCLVAVYNYLQVTNFFWMLVEGLYLHTMIVFAFSVENIPFWFYCLLGWGFPGIVIIAWIAVKANFEDQHCWLPMKNTYYDFVYLTPILLVLLINVGFLASIVYILITKLRASNTIQTRQYRKAVKATLILLPLLGVTHVLLITPPGDSPISKNIFVYFNAVLQSTQGLAVSVFYCFLNGEVRATIRTKFNRWQDGRSVATRYTRASIGTSGDALNLSARGSTLSNTLVATTNGRQPAQSQSLIRNNVENGFNHVSLGALKDEQL